MYFDKGNHDKETNLPNYRDAYCVRFDIGRICKSRSYASNCYSSPKNLCILLLMVECKSLARETRDQLSLYCFATSLARDNGCRWLFAGIELCWESAS